MKKLLLILFLICMIVTPVFAVGGTYTTYGNFYKPDFGAYGVAEWTEYNTYIDIADAAIEANKVMGEASVDTSGTPVDNDIAVFTDLNTIEGLSYAELKAVLDLEIGTDVQAYDAGLLSIAALTTAANKSIYTTALDTYSVYTLTAFARTILDDAAAGNVRTTIELGNVENTKLSTWAGSTNITTLGTIGTGTWEGTAVADGYIPNNITIDLATLATTFTATDNEDEALACLLVFVDGATGAQGAETDGDLTYNPSTGTLTATEFAGGGGGLTGVGVGVATSLTYDVKEENTSSIVKGQPVYQSGATGQAFPKVGLADSDDAAKSHVLGIADDAISKNGTGTVISAGVLEGVDSLGTNAVNPSGQTWTAGDLLYLHTTAGGLTNVEPTIGRVVEVGHSLYGSSNTDAIVLHLHMTHPHIEVATGEDIVLRVGDSAGSNKVIIKDYANNEVAYIDSDGNIDGTALTVDTALAIAEGGTGVTTGAMTGITSIYNTSLKFGRDADNLIDFTTDNKIVFRVNAADKIEMISTGELDMNAGSVGFTQQAVTGSDTTTTINWTLGNKFFFTFGAMNETLTFTDPSNPCNLLLVVKQDGTGSRTMTWPTILWAGGAAPTLTTAGNSIDIVSFYFDGTNYYGVASLAFATP